MVKREAPRRIIWDGFTGSYHLPTKLEGFLLEAWEQKQSPNFHLHCSVEGDSLERYMILQLRRIEVEE